MSDSSTITGNFIDAMKSQPLSLALVVMNIALLYLLWSIYVSSVDRMKLIFAEQEKVQLLLSRCVVPEGK